MHSRPRISVVIPAYNGAKTIRATIDSVLNQTVAAGEIIIIDDGSSDETPDILESYAPRVVYFRQTNCGVASTRNALIKKASGDLLAFVDNDDVWHPEYLATVDSLSTRFPNAVAFFTGHIDFNDNDGIEWPKADKSESASELIPPLDFLRRYNTTTGLFGSMSFCCVRREALRMLGDEPFHRELSGVDDSYLCTSLPLIGPVVYCPRQLVAYRMTSYNQSRNRLKMFALWVNVFRNLEPRYRTKGTRELNEVFSAAYAAKRRSFAKYLMGNGDKKSAREEFWRSAQNCTQVVSVLKSLGLLLSTWLPTALQPQWPKALRN